MGTSPIKRTYAFALAIVIGALLILQDFSAHVFHGYDFEFSWFTVSMKIMPALLLWALFSPLHFQIVQPYGQLTKPIYLLVLKLLIISVLIAVAHRVIAIRFFDVIFYFQSGELRALFSQYSLLLIVAGLFSSFLQFWMITALFFALDYYQKYLGKQKALNQAELSALRMQLQPHFLFNTLNSIASLIDIDQKSAQKMLSQLGFLLRTTLEQENEQFITFRKEMKYVQNYLAIEFVRFQDKLSIEYNITTETKDVLVPSLVLQPLAENAIKHGIANLLEHGTICIEGKLLPKYDCLEMTVTNSGNRLSTNLTKGYGIGIQNVERRLSQLYGTAYQFDYAWLDDFTYQTKITIPVRR